MKHMKHIKVFDRFINEGKVSIGNMKFSVLSSNDAKGLYVQFIPDGKTLDKFSKNDMVDNIKNKLDSAMPQFASALWFSIDNQTTGVIFRLDPYKLEEIITKAIK